VIRMAILTTLDQWVIALRAFRLAIHVTSRGPRTVVATAATGARAGIVPFPANFTIDTRGALIASLGIALVDLARIVFIAHGVALSETLGR